MQNQELVQAYRRIEKLEERLAHLEAARSRDQSSFWHLAFLRLANQDMIRGGFHTEILRAAGLLENAPLDEITEKVKGLFVDDPGYSLEPRLAELNLQAVRSELRGEYQTADDFNPKLKKPD
ncbi:hypothetical protein [Ensifer canadensis]|uniref:hypothetical protein n=1 Tax=Ensifer canadensis TaxID=555315 RepID=UPI0035E3C9E1